MARGHHGGRLRRKPIWQPRTLGERTLECQAQEGNLRAHLATTPLWCRYFKESWVLECSGFRGFSLPGKWGYVF